VVSVVESIYSEPVESTFSELACTEQACPERSRGSRSGTNR
jgi:hypothetical protein